MSNAPKSGFNKWLLAVAMLCQFLAVAGLTSPGLPRLARAEQTELVVNKKSNSPRHVSAKRAFALIFQAKQIFVEYPDYSRLANLHSFLCDIQFKLQCRRHAAFEPLPSNLHRVRKAEPRSFSPDPDHAA